MGSRSSGPTGRAGISWTDAAEQLERGGTLSNEDLRRVALLDAYGSLIGNTDRHLHNVMLFPVAGGDQLAPAYDQLPMAYAPPASGNLRNAAVSKPRPAVNTLPVWDDARQLAADFWHRASRQPLSESMRSIVSEHAARTRLAAPGDDH